MSSGTPRRRMRLRRRSVRLLGTLWQLVGPIALVVGFRTSDFGPIGLAVDFFLLGPTSSPMQAPIGKAISLFRHTPISWPRPHIGLVVK